MLPAVPTYLICRYGLADEGFVKRKRKQLLVEMKQPGGEPAPGMMDYVDPLRALEAMGARDIKVGKWDSQGIRKREREDGTHGRIALRCPGLLPCSNLVIGGKAEAGEERERERERDRV